MLELDQVWSKLLADASVNAARLGRSDIVEYLTLRGAKDKLRSAGVEWLLASTLQTAYSKAHLHRGFRIEREEPHSFGHANSNMVGVSLDVRYGVRCLSVEAGWVRTPADGIMRGGALAAARFSHFGLPALTTDLRLIHSGELPHWVDEDGETFGPERAGHHVELLVGI